jgi:hypothetical protein
LIELGQTPRLIELLWEPLAVAALNQSIDVASASPFATVLRDLFGGAARDAALAVPVVPLDELYAVPAQRFIEAHGGEVRPSAAARICFGGSDRREVRVVARGTEVTAPRVICAVPWHALPELFDDPPAPLSQVLANAGATAASPIVPVNVWFDAPISDEPLVGLPGRTMQWLFDKRRLLGGGASHLSMIASAADAIVGRTNEAVMALALDELRAAFPAARVASPRRTVVVREKRATFSVAPGQPSRPSTVTAVPGLLLAGDWIETGLPATIEGAVVSGHRAADAAARQ